jgi:hypothetical protein
MGRTRRDRSRPPVVLESQVPPAPPQRTVEIRLNQPVAIVFYPESAGLTPAIRDWQARNPDWRRPLEDIIICPVCGIPVRAIADFALLDWDSVRQEIRRYREEYLRVACSEHYWPTEAYWAVQASRIR